MAQVSSMIGIPLVSNPIKDSMKHLAIIPARGGSKGLKDKNIARLRGKPLISYTIQAAIESQVFDKIIVSTDSKKIASMSKGADILMRPKCYATDKVPIMPVILHALESYNEGYDTVTVLQPTSPLRTATHIKEAFKRFKQTKADSLLSVKEELHTIWRINKGIVEAVRKVEVNRQLLQPYYTGNGAIFITKFWVICGLGRRIGGKVELYPMDEISSTDIHSRKNLNLASYYLQSKCGGRL